MLELVTDQLPALQIGSAPVVETFKQLTPEDLAAESSRHAFRLPAPIVAQLIGQHPVLALTTLHLVSVRTTYAALADLLCSCPQLDNLAFHYLQIQYIGGPPDFAADPDPDLPPQVLPSPRNLSICLNGYYTDQTWTRWPEFSGVLTRRLSGPRLARYAARDHEDDLFVVSAWRDLDLHALKRIDLCRRPPLQNNIDEEVTCLCSAQMRADLLSGDQEEQLRVLLQGRDVEIHWCRSDWVTSRPIYWWI